MVLIAEWPKALVCGTSIGNDFASSNLVHHPPGTLMYPILPRSVIGITFGFGPDNSSSNLGRVTLR